MDSKTESRAKLEAARQQAVAEQALRDSEKVTPVRSAKDAINAMYAQAPAEQPNRRLAKSAKEIINSEGTNGDQKSAASLHQHTTKRRIDMERPSASGIFKTAPAEQPVVPDDTSRAMDPLAQKITPVTKPRPVRPAEPAAPTVIKTSLKLGPKKTPAHAPTRANASSPSAKSLNGQKGRTALSQLLSNRRAPQTPPPPTAPAAHSSSPSSASAQPTTSEVPALDPQTAATLRAMRQAVKKVTHPTPASSTTISKTSPPPKTRTSRGLMQDIIRPVHPASTQRTPNVPTSSTTRSPHRPTLIAQDGLPIDSVKHRFRAAPKGYTAAPEVQPTSYTNFTDVEPQKKPPVEIYGLMDDEPVAKRPELPVIEDYHPEGKPTPAREAKAPDNNKYALGGQSPFFLKSVNVEKRPLSGSIGSKTAPSEGTLYQRPASTPVGGKNVYDRKEARKAMPTKPTVIIPASRRSRAPLIFLLILTVVLGAAMGAFIYLCFFQYME